MGQIVVNGAMIACPMGLPGTATLSIMPTSMVQGTDQPVATIQDMVPMTNIATFGMCTSLANPQVAAATSAALGRAHPAAVHPGHRRTVVAGRVDGRGRQHPGPHVGQHLHLHVGRDDLDHDARPDDDADRVGRSVAFADDVDERFAAGVAADLLERELPRPLALPRGHRSRHGA